MKEIYDINIQRMNNGAHFTFVSNILARAEDLNLTNRFVHRRISPIAIAKI